MSEASEIQAAQNGDNRAMTALLRRHAGLLCMWSRARPGEQEDALQEAAIAFIGAVRCFDPSRGVKLITYASFRVRARVEREIRRRRGAACVPVNATGEAADLARSAGADLDACPRDASDEPGPEELLSRAEVRRAVASLPQRERIVVQRRMQGETLETIAADFGVTRERVRQIENKAHERLRRRLAGRTNTRRPDR